MPITRWDPFSEMNRLQEQLFGASNGETRAFRPAVDIHEGEEAFTVHAELPGVSPEDVHVDVEKNVLTIRGERKLAKDEEKDGYRRVERFFGSFARSFSLPETVDADAIDAKLDGGVLELTIPKRPASSPRRIQVKS